ncbi:MAG: PIG-L family deacetylase [Pirellulales bacterium]|nr:PIG-L family deacetylase [Pirellulales bacterium]
MATPLRLLILGAHPDDCEYHAGGLAALYAAGGHAVRMISVTNGAAGHQSLSGPPLAELRRQEAAAAAARIGAESAVWEYPDAALEPTLEVRARVIRELRTFRPDLVLTHRTSDYHPDHRAVAHAVRDAAYLVTVPAVVPEVPILRRMPVIASMPDRFTRPAPLAGDVVVDVGPVLDAIVDMLACHASQFFEWLPFNLERLEEVPTAPAARRQWLYDWYTAHLRPAADSYRRELIAAYGPVRGSEVAWCEAYEISEYAAPLDTAARHRLFGFLLGPA